MKSRKPAKAGPVSRKVSLEHERERQRAVCIRLLERFVPVAIRRPRAADEPGTEDDGGDESLEAGFKAGAFVLKVLERMARLDGLDAAEKSDVTVSELADPLELARRVEAVSPVLKARLRLGDLTKE